jgi:hypothetical protein
LEALCALNLSPSVPRFLAPGRSAEKAKSLENPFGLPRLRGHLGCDALRFLSDQHAADWLNKGF